MFPIRSLLDALGEADAEALIRLSELRGVGGRGLAATIESLRRFYGDDRALFLSDLRKVDLVVLLSQPIGFYEGKHYLPSASMYSKEDLAALAVKAFRDGVIPAAFVAFEGDDADEGDDREDEDDEDEESEEEDNDDEIDHTGAKYEEQFRRELSYSREDADRPLRNYQDEAVEAVLAALEPTKPKILHLATGGGKTRVANTIVDR